MPKRLSATRTKELVRELRRSGMRYAAFEPDELAQLATQLRSAENMIWIRSLGAAVRSAGAMQRHSRLVEASIRFAEEMRAILADELLELGRKPRRPRK